MSAKQNLPPTCLPWFQGVNRFWDPHKKCYVAKIMPGEYYVTIEKELIGTVLGSCVSACVRDPKTGIGGMNHFMLPQNSQSNVSVISDAYRYGNFAMEHLINDVMKLSGSRDRLEFKLFGGGNVIRSMGSIGDKNINFVRKYLEVEGFRVSAEDLGGNHPRKILYDPKTGKVLLKRIESLHNDTVLKREEKYMDSLKQQPVESGDIDLF